MLEYVSILLPGLLFAYAVEVLMKRKLSKSGFLCLSAVNILALNALLLLLRGDEIVLFRDAGGYVLALSNMEYATILLKQMILTCLAGIPLCLAEAFIGKYIHLSLDDTKKEEAHE